MSAKRELKNYAQEIDAAKHRYEEALHKVVLADTPRAVSRFVENENISDEVKRSVQENVTCVPVYTDVVVYRKYGDNACIYTVYLEWNGTSVAMFFTEEINDIELFRGLNYNAYGYDIRVGALGELPIWWKTDELDQEDRIAILKVARE